VNRIGRCTIMCMLLIAALAIIWNLLGLIIVSLPRQTAQGRAT
jgi:hypothetical protein